MIGQQDREWMKRLAGELDRALRFGWSPDDPEGVGYIKMSDTLARDIADKLRAIAEADDGREHGSQDRNG